MLITDNSVRIPLTILLRTSRTLCYWYVPAFLMVRLFVFSSNYELTTKWFEQVFTKYHGSQAFSDLFMFSLIAAPITALLSMIISYLVAKRRFRGRGFIEAVSMLAMAVPGTCWLYSRFLKWCYNTDFLQARMARTYPDYWFCRASASYRNTFVTSASTD